MSPGWFLKYVASASQALKKSSLNIIVCYYLAVGEVWEAVELVSRVMTAFIIKILFFFTIIHIVLISRHLSEISVLFTLDEPL